MFRVGFVVYEFSLGRWDAENDEGTESLTPICPQKGFQANFERLWFRSGLEPCGPMSVRNATWLILPVVICLSQRLSHACVSMN